MILTRNLTLLRVIPLFGGGGQADGLDSRESTTGGGIVRERVKFLLYEKARAYLDWSKSSRMKNQDNGKNANYGKYIPIASIFLEQ